MELPKDKKIILFDGVCNLCDTVVQRIIKADKNDQFRFMWLGADNAKHLLDLVGIDPLKTDSIVLFEPGKKHYIESQAVLRIAYHLSGPYKLLGVFKILPKSIADRLYRFIARNRYGVFGKKQACLLPEKNILNKFL